MKSVIQYSVFILLLQSNFSSASIFSTISNVLSSIASEVASIENTTVTALEDFFSSAANGTIGEVTTSLETILNTTLSSFKITKFLENYVEHISEDERLDFEGLVAKYLTNSTVTGYDIVTDDGYILKLYNIPGNTSKPVMLAHGILLASDCFLARGNTSLIYELVQNGYDVWALNFRGNRYSRRHETLDPDTDALFWDYSIDQLGYYDLPASIDFVLNTTGQSKLSYVGNSEGCTTFFMLTSARPEYNNKIKIFAGLAPVVYCTNSGLAWKTLSKLGPAINGILDVLEYQELVGYNSTVKQLINVVCTQEVIGYEICAKGILFTLFGYGPENIDAEFCDTIWGQFPAGMSKKNLYHYFQMVNSGKFRKFDYGPYANSKIYGSVDPPTYYLQNTTCPTALFVAGNDYVVAKRDAEQVQSELSNVVSYFLVDDPMFTHQDFVWGKNASAVVYGNVTQILDQYA